MPNFQTTQPLGLYCVLPYLCSCWWGVALTSNFVLIFRQQESDAISRTIFFTLGILPLPTFLLKNILKLLKVIPSLHLIKIGSNNSKLVQIRTELSKMDQIVLIFFSFIAIFFFISVHIIEKYKVVSKQRYKTRLTA